MYATNDAMKASVPSRWLRNPHAMTLAAAFWRRKYPQLPASTSRLFDVEPGTQIRGECHMQESSRDHAAYDLNGKHDVRQHNDLAAS
jgi:hypothetical protein